MAELTDIRESVRERYAGGRRRGRRVLRPTGGEPRRLQRTMFGAALYGDEAGEAPAVGGLAGLRRADRGRRPAPGRDRARPRLGRRRRRPHLRPPRRPGRPRDRARHDRRDARLARANAAAAGVDNAEFVKGYLEDIPLADTSVDVVISNCVINLAADKRVVLPRPRASCGPAAASRSPT